MERWFLSQKGSGGGRGVNEKKQGLNNDATKDTIEVVSSTIDKTVVIYLGGSIVRKVNIYGNNNGRKDGNVVQCSTSITSIAIPNEGFVPLTRASAVLVNITNSPTEVTTTRGINNSGLISLGPASYAKIITCELSRKSFNFHALLALVAFVKHLDGIHDLGFIREETRQKSQLFSFTTTILTWSPIVRMACNVFSWCWTNICSTMASVIICLANNKKFNFSTYIFYNMVKNLEVGDKFFMFSRFVQVFVNHQLGDMSHCKKIFSTPSLTKKVFANMKREGKGFSGIITPLFETMMVQAPEEDDKGSERKKTEVPHTEPQTEESVLTTSNDPLPSESFEDKESLGDQEDASKQERMINNIDQDEEITLVDETHGRMNEEEMFRVNDLDGDEVIMDATAGEEVKQSTIVAGKEVSTADPVTTDGEVVTTAKDVKANDKCKGIMVEPEKPLKKKDQFKFNEEVARKLEAPKAKMEEEERIEKLDEQAEAEVDNDQREAEMKMYMKIIPDDEITIDAISLATKPSIIVNWKIIKEGKISSYHLIRANGSSKRYSSMIQML
uniref:Uncharacterized protein n=1 Tax=Tanacetum cinerariifolium TaxID=118510 RepID=A0A6L2KGZ7_TANCI|nr:hypothetical protein [Tanacetum cinerariifolium]